MSSNFRRPIKIKINPYKEKRYTSNHQENNNCKINYSSRKMLENYKKDKKYRLLSGSAPNIYNTNKTKGNFKPSKRYNTPFIMRASDNSYNFNKTSKQFYNNYYYPKIQNIWKYSYYIDKNNSVSNLLSHLKKRKQTFSDNFFGESTSPEYSAYPAIKPRMVRIIENNKAIEDEISSFPWKYKYLFQNNISKKESKLFRLFLKGPLKERVNINNNNNENYTSNTFYNNNDVNENSYIKNHQPCSNSSKSSMEN